MPGIALWLNILKLKTFQQNMCAGANVCQNQAQQKVTVITFQSNCNAKLIVSDSKVI